MKREQIQIGKVYAVKVSGSVAPVKIREDLGDKTDYRGYTRHRGWAGENLKSGRGVHVATAQKCRFEMNAQGSGPLMPNPNPAKTYHKGSGPAQPLATGEGVDAQIRQLVRQAIVQGLEDDDWQDRLVNAINEEDLLNVNVEGQEFEGSEGERRFKLATEYFDKMIGTLISLMKGAKTSGVQTH